MSTAFPQPLPGTAPSPGPLKVPADQLERVLGTTKVKFVAGRHHLAVADSTLAGTPVEDASAVLRSAAATTAAKAQSAEPARANETSSSAKSVRASIDNFAFAPQELTIPTGSTIAWINKDDTPHTVTSDDGAFASPIMDTDQSFQFKFLKAGRFPYRCKLHPTMTGVVVVT
jgi:plastocyanin